MLSVNVNVPGPVRRRRRSQKKSFFSSFASKLSLNNLDDDAGAGPLFPKRNHPFGGSTIPPPKSNQPW